MSASTAATKVAYTIAEAAEAVGFSERTIRRAIQAVDPAVFPPPLRAKNIGSDRKPSYRILAVELQRWADSWADA